MTAEQARKPIDWAEVRSRIGRALADAGEAAESAERDRAIMAERGRRLARRPQEARPDSLPLAVVFSADRARYALPTPYVREVARSGRIAPVPGASDLLLGVTSHRGEVLAVFQTRILFGGEAQHASDSDWLVVCGRGQAEFALLSDAVPELMPLDPRESLAPIGPAQSAGRAHLRGITPDAVLLLDGESLLADRRLTIDQT